MKISKSEPIIRRATVNDMPAIQEFVRETYDRSAPFKDSARYQWQFENSPFRPAAEAEPTIWLALDGIRVVGTIAVQDGAFRMDKQLIPAGWIVDVMVHPDYRGQRLSHRIHDAILIERTILITLTMAPATRRVAERAGCITLGPTRQFIMPHRLSARTVVRYLEYKAHMGSPVREKLLRIFNATALGPILVSSAGRLLSKVSGSRIRSRALIGYSYAEVDCFPSEVDELWDRSCNKYLAIFERSTRFLNWRIGDCPGLAYRRFLLYRNEAIVGYLVTRVGNEVELPLGVVVDAFADPENEGALDALLGLAWQILSPEAEYLEAAASSRPWQAALSRVGFIAVKTMRPTIVCTDTALRERLKQHSDAWHFTKIDHDWDQIHPV